MSDIRNTIIEKRLTEEEIERILNELGVEKPKMCFTSGPKFWCRQTAEEVLRYARDKGYIGGLTVDEAMEVAEPFIEAEAEMEDGARGNWETKHQKYQAMTMDLRARFTSKLSQH